MKKILAKTKYPTNLILNSKAGGTVLHFELQYLTWLIYNTVQLICKNFTSSYEGFNSITPITMSNVYSCHYNTSLLPDHLTSFILPSFLFFFCLLMILPLLPTYIFPNLLFFHYHPMYSTVQSSFPLFFILFCPLSFSCSYRYYGIAIVNAQGKKLRMPKGSVTVTYQIHRYDMTDVLYISCAIPQ